MLIVPELFAIENLPIQPQAETYFTTPTPGAANRTEADAPTEPPIFSRTERHVCRTVLLDADSPFAVGDHSLYDRRLDPDRVISCLCGPVADQYHDADSRPRVSGGLRPQSGRQSGLPQPGQHRGQLQFGSAADRAGYVRHGVGRHMADAGHGGVH